MSSKVYPNGKVEITVAASAVLSAFSKGKYKIYYQVGFPNRPNIWKLLKEGAANEEYESSAFSAATKVRIEAGASEVLYNQGTDAVPIEKRNALNQSAPVALNSTGAITLAALMAGIITSTTGAAVTGTLPVATLIDAGVEIAIGEAIDFSVITLGAANAFTVAVDTGVTAVGGLVVAASSSGRFRLRKTATATYILYRLS